MFEIKDISLNFSLISKEQPQGGDDLFFGFINLDNHLKTYCYISQSQIDELSKKYHISKSNEGSLLKTSWLTKKQAQESKTFFNLGLIPLANGLHDPKYSYRVFKNTPFLQFAFSDKPQIFHKIKNQPFSYEDLKKIRFSSFNFTGWDESRKANSVCYKIKDISSLKELALFIFGEDSKELRKVSLKILWKKYDKNDWDLNYEMIRFVWLMKKYFSNLEIAYILQNEMDKILKLPLFESVCYLRDNESNFSGLNLFFNNIKSFEDRKRIFLKNNIPTHILKDFSMVMEKAYPILKPDLSKVSNMLYFYNNLSRDYGRLSLPNNLFIPLEKYSEICKVLSNLEIEGFSYQIPKDYHTMIEWGSKLHNCVGNFDQKDRYFKSLPVAIFKNDKIIWLFDVVEKYGIIQISQFEGFKRKLPTKKELEVLLKPLDGKLGISVKDNIDKLKSNSLFE